MEPADLDATQCQVAREALGLGVPELAAKAGVSPDTVSRLEKGRDGASAHRRSNPRGARRCGR
jgi:transcriptional regulator with XRE-family HTH domain